MLSTTCVDNMLTHQRDALLNYPVCVEKYKINGAHWGEIYMKETSSQIAIAAVCCILGFMLAYQFKLLGKQENNVMKNNNGMQVTAEIAQYQKEKADLDTKINYVQVQIKKYQTESAGSSDQSKGLLKEMENSKMLLGNYDVSGQGVIIYLTPKTSVLGNNTDVVSQLITDRDLVYIVNELNYAGAEAITINDERISMRTGIKSSSNNSYIVINDAKISPAKRITIKAIGDISLLLSTLQFPDELNDFNSYTVTYDKYNNIKILKSTTIQKFQYAKPSQ